MQPHEEAYAKALAGQPPDHAQEAGIRPGWQIKEIEGHGIRGNEHMTRLEKEMLAKKKKLTVYTNMWLGYEYITAVKLLGVDWASGLRVQYTSAKRRLAKATEVARNLKAMAVPGVSYINIIRAQAMGSTRYGVATIGMPKVILDGVRRIVRATTSTKAKGGSATADLALQKRGRRVQQCQDKTWRHTEFQPEL